MKWLSIVVLVLVSVGVKAQTGPLPKEESARMTQDQRVIYETDRKTKRGKKDISLKKRVKVAKKTDSKSRKIQQPRKQKPKKAKGK
ncbi:MAG: hypothetical protein KF803_11385 [Cyclobacteriaceae bacterium]|nr:hypothetical protein [Cyclobacteriaceae bacterium]